MSYLCFIVTHSIWYVWFDFLRIWILHIVFREAAGAYAENQKISQIRKVYSVSRSIWHFVWFWLLSSFSINSRYILAFEYMVLVRNNKTDLVSSCFYDFCYISASCFDTHLQHRTVMEGVPTIRDFYQQNAGWKTHPWENQGIPNCQESNQGKKCIKWTWIQGTV